MKQLRENGPQEPDPERPNRFQEPEQIKPAAAESKPASLEFLDTGSEKLAAIYDRAKDLLGKVNSAPITPERKTELKSKVGGYIFRAAKLMRVAAMIMCLGAMHELGEREINNIDMETDHVLKVFSGMEGLTNEDKEIVLRNALRGQLASAISFYDEYGPSAKDPEIHKVFVEAESKDKESLTNINEMDIQKIFGLLARETTSPEKVPVDETLAEFKAGRINYDEELERIFETRVGKLETDKSSKPAKYYSALKELLNECGRPKLRFRLKENNYQPNPGEDERSFFKQNQFTAFLDIPVDNYSSGALVAELAHAKQWDAFPDTSDRQFARDAASVSRMSKASGQSYRKTYDKTMYNSQGSVEYQAHKLIEPELKKRLKNLQAGTAKPPVEIQNADLLFRQRLDEMENKLFRQIVENSQDYTNKFKYATSDLEKRQLERSHKSKSAAIEVEYEKNRKNFQEQFWRDYKMKK
ncbi:MAG: hypothetical protein P4L74_04720 [Candidatus Doudnabacteria bacterium]|nr:hypothetical protein [Candidatus Doudnabacteria bacterium]